MIKVEYNTSLFKSSDGIFTLTISGHSGKGVKGEDIICSAVSALSQGFVLSLNRLIKIEQDVTQRDGFLRTEIRSMTAQQAQQVDLLFQSFVLGLNEIRKQYPDYVSIKGD